MYYLVNVNHNGTAAQVTGSDVKGFKKCCTFNVKYETDGDMLWNGSEEQGNVRSEGDGDECSNCRDGNRDTDWYIVTCFV